MTPERAEKIEKFLHWAQAMWALKIGDKIEQKHFDIIRAVFGEPIKEELLIHIQATRTGRPIITKGAELVDNKKFFKQFESPKEK